jgi:dTDP-4-dehydrorhamnose 3,5-epimerase-like enzyme
MLDQVRWLSLTDVKDPRGHLTAVEAGIHLPFEIRRVFYVHRVTPGVPRGGHAHRDTDQAAVAVHGSMRIDVSDGYVEKTYLLDAPERALYLPRMVWTRLYDFSPGCVLVVFASTHYDASMSIRTWAEYLAERGAPDRPEPGGA